MKDEFDIIDLDETANIDRLALAAELEKQENGKYLKDEYYEDENYEEDNYDYDEEFSSDAEVDSAADAEMAEADEEPAADETEDLDLKYIETGDAATEYEEESADAEQSEATDPDLEYIEEYDESEGEYIEDSDVEYIEDAEYEDSDLDYMEDDLDYVDSDIEYMDEESEYYEDEDESDEEDEDDDDEDEEDGFIGKLKTLFSKLNKSDWIAIGAGAVVLIALIIGLSIFTMSNSKKEVTSLYNVGVDYASLTNAGMDGLRNMAVYAMNYSPQPVEEEVEEPLDTSVIRVTFISVSEDIKIKFITEDDRLITGIPFEVTLTYEEKNSSNMKQGETVTLSDDDMNGIIHESNMEPGKYSVEVAPVEGSTFTGLDEEVVVKGQVEYQVIDVSDEVKKESEINAAVEDTAINAVVEEAPTTTDTVEFVESGRTSDDGSDGYIIIDKSNIVSPDSAKAETRFEVVNEILSTDHNVTLNYRTVLRDDEDNTDNGDGDNNGGDNNNGNTDNSGSDNGGSTDGGNSGSDQPPVCTRVTVSANPTTIKTGATTTLQVTAYMSDGSSVIDITKFTITTSESGIVEIDSKGTVTAKNAGRVTVTVVYGDKSDVVHLIVESAGTDQSTDNQSGNQQAPADHTTDTTTPLKTTSGQKVYVKNPDGTYRVATYADYYTASEFYVESSNYTYTGWQTIDGNTYYFDKDGNKVTGDQIIQGVSYSFTSDGILATNTSGSKGIDVSKWNGSINWTAVKNSGVSFVIIRCGYRGSTSGALIEDPTFRTNIQGARAAGLKVGIYFFTQAVTEAEAVEEASMAVSLARNYGVNYPIFIDTEGSGGRADGLSKAARTAVCKAFCQTVQNSGYTAGVYASKAWFISNVDYGQLSGYKIWLAQYASAPTLNARYDLWQYTSKGSVSGINGNVDMNISYLGY